jgi:hypothetical protein
MSLRRIACGVLAGIPELVVASQGPWLLVAVMSVLLPALIYGAILTVTLGLPVYIIMRIIRAARQRSTVEQRLDVGEPDELHRRAGFQARDAWRRPYGSAQHGRHLS